MNKDEIIRYYDDLMRLAISKCGSQMLVKNDLIAQNLLILAYEKCRLLLSARSACLRRIIRRALPSSGAAKQVDFCRFLCYTYFKEKN